MIPIYATTSTNAFAWQPTRAWFYLATYGESPYYVGDKRLAYAVANSGWYGSPYSKDATSEYEAGISYILQRPALMPLGKSQFDPLHYNMDYNAVLKPEG